MILEDSSTIHDLTWARLGPPSNDRPTTLLALDDHWLRRVARVEYIHFASGEVVVRQRRIADEVWALLAGHLRLELTDARRASPTRGTRQAFDLSEPTRVLVPFGVALRAEFLLDSSVVRMTTHSEIEDPPVSD